MTIRHSLSLVTMILALGVVSAVASDQQADSANLIAQAQVRTGRTYADNQATENSNREVKQETRTRNQKDDGEVGEKENGAQHETEDSAVGQKEDGAQNQREDGATGQKEDGAQGQADQGQQGNNSQGGQQGGFDQGE